MSDAANNNPKPPDSHNRSPTSGGHITWTHNRVPLRLTAQVVADCFLLLDALLVPHQLVPLATPPDTKMQGVVPPGI